MLRWSRRRIITSAVRQLCTSVWVLALFRLAAMYWGRVWAMMNGADKWSAARVSIRPAPCSWSTCSEAWIHTLKNKDSDRVPIGPQGSHSTWGFWLKIFQGSGQSRTFRDGDWNRKSFSFQQQRAEGHSYKRHSDINEICFGRNSGNQYKFLRLWKTKLLWFLSVPHIRNLLHPTQSIDCGA